MSEEDLYRARLGKLDDLGAEAWPVRFGPTESASELQERYSGLEPGSESGDVVSVAGRLVATREQGRLAFGDLQDRTGRIQLFVTRDLVERFKELDTGDIVGATGEVMRTKLGELSVRPSELVMLAKSLRPLPDKWHGLKDVEVRFRQRYLDLISNPDSQRIARLRSAVIRA
ncbi:MAG TPA: OB-fold nucleic acid binding domain-containing protein, partial [Actinomycetota bacterium]|nr:OB-fold nucleic acid binding domain-containing protein [Actinomycetota bacterium]